MKGLALVACAVLTAAWLVGCGSGDVMTTVSQESSMKGFELYSWQDGDQWHFSLLVGTNREKSLDEIRSPESALSGVEALRAALERIKAGEYVTWASRDTLAFPPDDVVGQVEQICEDRGLQLSVLR